MTAISGLYQKLDNILVDLCNRIIFLGDEMILNVESITISRVVISNCNL